MEGRTARVGIAIFPEVTEGWVFDLPGCHAFGRSVDAVKDSLPLSVEEYLVWLRRQGEDAPAPGPIGPIGLEFVEEVDVAKTSEAGGEFCFEADRASVGDEEIEAAVCLMGYSRADLKRAAGGLTDTLLDWRPPPSALDRIDDWAPDVRSIREIMAHIASAEGYYTGNISLGALPDQTLEQRTDLEGQRERAVRRLRSLSDEDRGRVLHRRHQWQESEECWTVRKAIRRYIGHERFHTKEIEQRLAWLLVGIPKRPHGDGS